MRCVASDTSENRRLTVINIAMYLAGGVSVLLLVITLVFIVSVRIRLRGSCILQQLYLCEIVN